MILKCPECKEEVFVSDRNPEVSECPSCDTLVRVAHDRVKDEYFLLRRKHD